MQPSTLLVSAGLLAPKKGDHKFARKHNYLNYGLLSLGTVLHEAGRAVRLVHGGFSAPEDLADRLANEYPESSSQPLLMSLPSYMAVPWAQSFLRSLRRRWPAVPIVVGGRWVVGDGGEWIRSRLPEANLVVYGTAEERVLPLLDRGRWVNLPGTDRSALLGPAEAWNGHIDLNYELMETFLDFTPSIEVSRGCGRGCSFCEEKSAQLTGMREPASVVQAMQRAVDLYADSRLHFYLEASWFVPSRSWVSEFEGEYARSGLKTAWRCETRVDSLPTDLIAGLSRSGLRVLDLGLESASATQLVSMNKTRDPDRYLRKASELLHRCHDVGVWPKVNVMLFAGETPRTVEQTREWLDRHRHLIKGVSVGAVTVYGHGANAQANMMDLCALGASPVNGDALERDGYAELNLSPEVDYQEARRLATDITQSLMSDQDYYDLKAFSYLPRGYTYDDFRADLNGVQQHEVPFRLP